jgi:hypothetical protein
MQAQARKFRVPPRIGAFVSVASPGLALLLGLTAVHYGLANTRALSSSLALVLAFGTYLGFSAGRSQESVIVRAIGYIGGAFSAIYLMILAAIASFGLR